MRVPELVPTKAEGWVGTTPRPDQPCQALLASNCPQLALVILMITGVHFIEAYGLNPAIYSAHLKVGAVHTCPSCRCSVLPPAPALAQPAHRPRLLTCDPCCVTTYLTPAAHSLRAVTAYLTDAAHPLLPTAAPAARAHGAGGGGALAGRVGPAAGGATHGVHARLRAAVRAGWLGNFRPLKWPGLGIGGAAPSCPFLPSRLAMCCNARLAVLTERARVPWHCKLKRPLGRGEGACLSHALAWIVQPPRD